MSRVMDSGQTGQWVRAQTPCHLWAWISIAPRLGCELTEWGMDGVDRLAASWDQASLGRPLSHPRAALLPTDDGKLSLEEFQLFFADGVLNEQELESLFHTIDADSTK